MDISSLVNMVREISDGFHDINNALCGDMVQHFTSESQTNK